MKLKGSITIFLSLVILVVLACICTVIESARICVVQMEGKAATFMAVDSVFASYGKQLYNDYGILLAWERESLSEKTKRYVQDNIEMADLEDVKHDFMKMKVENVQVVRQQYATDKGGEAFITQVEKLMKYAAVKDGVEQIINNFNNGKKDIETEKEERNVTSIANEVSDEVIEIVEDIQKEVKTLKDTKKLKGKITSVRQKYEILDGDIMSGSPNQEAHNKKVRKFLSKYKKLIERLEKEETQITTTLKYMEEYINKKKEVEVEFGILESDYMDYIEEDMLALQQVQQNINQIFQEHVEKFSDINAGNKKRVEDILEKVKLVEKQLWELKIKEKESDTSREEGIYNNAVNLINTGVLSLVIDDVNTVSTTSIQNLNLPTTLEKTKIEMSMIENAKKRAMFIKYVEFYFNNYAERAKSSNKDTTLQYEVEYILCGKLNDKENLTKTIEKLLGIRNAANMAYLITDAEKMQEVRTLSETLAIAFGAPFLTPAIQVIVLEAWSLTEAIMDVRALVKGEKIELIKTKDSWQSDLMSIGQTSCGKEQKTGLTYTEYLQLLMMAQDTNDTVFRTMDLIQVNIQNRYNKEFLMKNCFDNCELATTFVIQPVFSAIPIVQQIVNEENEAYKFQVEVGYQY